MDLINIEIPHIEQSSGVQNKKYREKRTCGLACLKMFFEYQENKSPSFDELISYGNAEFICLSLIDGSEKKYRFFMLESGWLHYGLISIARIYGYNGIFERSYNYQNTLEKLEFQLKSGYFIIASVNRYPEYKGKRRGHLVVVKGIKKIGNKFWIIVNDPAKNKGNTNITIKTFLKNFNFSTILLKKDNEEKNQANYPIYINEEIYEGNNICYIHIHEDEILAYNETKNYIKDNGGLLLSLHQNQERFIRFQIENNGENIYLRIDPNRIFDDINLKKTITERNIHLKQELIPQAFAKGILIRNYIINKLNHFKGDKIVGIHTNKYLNIHDFIGKTEYIFINQKLPKNTFIIASDKEDFETIKSQNISVIYFEQLENDGSLGDYLKQKGKRYFTIETGEKDGYNYEKLLNIVSKL